MGGVNVRFEESEIDHMDRLITGGVAGSRSELLRMAWTDFKAKYSGEITPRTALTEIKTLKRQYTDHERRMRYLEQSLEEIKDKSP